MSESEMTKQQFLGELFAWCFRWGCSIELRNKAWNQPVMSPSDRFAVGESHELDRNGDLVDVAHMSRAVVIEIPELVFRKNDRAISIMAMDWNDLIKRFAYEHKRIYAELGVPVWSAR